MLVPCHRLGSGTYSRFVAMMSGSSGKGPSTATAPRAAIGEAPRLLDGPGPHDQDDDDEVAQGGAPDGNSDGGNKNVDHAKVNDTNRKIASHWWNTGPLPMLVLIRLVVEPLRYLMTAKYDMSSEEWEQLKQTS